MSGERQTQRGGEGSLQIQVAGDYIVGIDEARAKEIAIATSQQVIAEYTQEALATVQARIDELDTRVIRTLDEKGQLNAFADPAFQRTVKKAQNSAAATERESDYDMLAALLSDRAGNPRDRMSMAGIDRAIEIVDLVDDEALRGLTVLHAVGTWVPASSFLGDGLNALERIFSQLIDGPLPLGNEWAEHLDVLDAVRVGSIGTMRDYDELMLSRMDGYTAAGLPTEEVPEFVGGSFPEGYPWSHFVVDHELRPGYKRIATPTMEKLRELMKEQGFQEDAIVEIEGHAKNLFGIGNTEPQVREAFMTELNSRPALRAVGEWWAQIFTVVQPTTVGKTLATANAFRLDAEGRLPREG